MRPIPTGRADEAGRDANDGQSTRASTTVGEYVKGKASINGMESFWSMLKRGYVGTFRRMSREHLAADDTADQMAAMVRGAEGQRLRYADLIDHGGRKATAV